MSLTDLADQVLSLSAEERRQFAAWFYAHESELAGRPPDAADDLGDAQKAELTRRLQEIEDHPEILLPFEESDVEKMFAEIAHAHAPQAPARRS